MNRFLVVLCGFSLAGLSLIFAHIFYVVYVYGGLRLVEPLRWLVVLEGGLMVCGVVIGLLTVREASR